MSDKQFRISRDTVYRAYQKVKRNKGRSGCDDIDFERFEEHLDGNLYKIWNRMSSGTYFPQPVLEVEIPKKNGKMRKLGIPTIEDRVAQMVARSYFEPLVEPVFVEDSYGYRPRKSPIEAIAAAKERCWRYDYVVELDIKGLFDNIDHRLLMKVVDLYEPEPWVRLYITRWLTVPFVDRDGNLTPRTSGTPQGGVISPVLANVFMHHAFDLWMQANHPEAPFERYADDAIIHCKTRQEAETLKAELKERFAKCRLEMNEEKTRIAYCKDSNRRKEEPITEFTFLGYTFRREWVRGRRGWFWSFQPRVSNEACVKFRDDIRELKFHRWSGQDIEGLARKLNPKIQGWINYYGRYMPWAIRATLNWLDGRLVAWAMRKYGKLRRSWRKAWKWFYIVKTEQPELFAHWRLMNATAA